LARERVWTLTGPPDRVTIDVDATLVGSHSEKEGAAGNYKGGYGFHPLMAYCDETGEALAAVLRPGNAGSNTAADHVDVIEDALAQIPAELIETIEIVVRANSAGATHELLGFCREHRLRYTVGYELTDAVRAAIRKLPEDPWIAALAADGRERENGQIAEISIATSRSSSAASANARTPRRRSACRGFESLLRHYVLSWYPQGLCVLRMLSAPAVVAPTVIAAGPASRVRGAGHG